MDRHFDGCECHRFCVLQSFPNDLETGNQAAKGHKNAKLPRAIVDLRQAARALTPEAIATLRRLNNDESIAPVVQLAAANSILDRGWGKPKETLDKTLNLNMTRTNKLDISTLFEEQLDALKPL